MGKMLRRFLMVKKVKELVATISLVFPVSRAPPLTRFSKLAEVLKVIKDKP